MIEVLLTRRIEAKIVKSEIYDISESKSKVIRIRNFQKLVNISWGLLRSLVRRNTCELEGLF